MDNYGRAFYEAFARHMGWRTTRGATMPLWEELPAYVQAALDVGAEGVTEAFFEDAEPPESARPPSGTWLR